MTDFERWFRDAVDEHGSPLSEAGASRRQAMRTALTGAVVRRRRTRRGVRGASALALLAGVVWLAWWSIGTAAVGERQDVAHEPRLQHIALQIVADDPDILARYALPSRPLPPETWIDDAQLLQLLRDADRPTGLLRRGDRVELTENVTDQLGE